MHNALLLLPLLALGLFALFPWPLALTLYLPILAGSLVAYWKAIQAQREAPAMGESAMIGERAVVAGGEGQELQVEYKGEIWRAVSQYPLHPGQEVTIDKVEGLTLRVTPSSRPSRAEKGR